MEERQTPEELMQAYHLDHQSKQGKLKIFLGYAAGVGKTYAMLKAAHRAKDTGIDVVAGYVEPHHRPDTARLLEGLEQLPAMELTYRDILLHEFDLEAALRRKPQLILVDELAHTNADGCRNKKRYQDVEELLRAGIDVYTTVNIQHLESLNDVVASITGIHVQERVPDWVFDSADQTEIVDIEPDDLIARLKDGRIYQKKRAEKAMESFFTVRNLAALREIALRRTADRLNYSASQTSRHENASEWIMICLSASPTNAKVIRTAARMALALNAKFTALFVETSAYAEYSKQNRHRLQQNRKMAEDLGAETVTVYGDDIAVQIAEYAKAGGITKIVLGRSIQRNHFFYTKRSLVDRLAILAPDLDIYIIPDRQPEVRPGLWRRLHISGSSHLPKVLLTDILLLTAASAIGLIFYQMNFSESTIIIIYLLAVLLAAVLTGSWVGGAVISLLGVLTFNYFFTVPRFTLQAYAPSYPITFVIMFITSCIATSLVLRIKWQSRQAAEKAYRTEVLLETSQRLQIAEGSEMILTATMEQIQKLLRCPVLYYGVDEQQLTGCTCFDLDGAPFPKDGLSEKEKAVAQWACTNNKHAGATTDTLFGAKCLYMTVRGQNKVFAVAGIYLGEDKTIGIYEKNLLLAILNECGMALEKEKLLESKHFIETRARQEELRANLLREISHDLRTPLTTISGNAAVLIGNSVVLDETKKQKLYTDIYDDSQWLSKLVENLLSITKIGQGSVPLQIQPELVADVFQDALKHLDRHANEHSIQVVQEDDLLMAEMDARLIVQVVINLVNNAIKYTPTGSHIVLKAEKKDQKVLISVSDDGPGIDSTDLPHLFEMFYTGDNSRMDGRRGIGIGLSLCKSIAEAHGGAISVENRQPHGAVFHLTLKEAEVDIHE